MKKLVRLISCALCAAILGSSLASCSSPNASSSANDGSSAAASQTEESKDDASAADDAQPEEYVTIVVGNWPPETEPETRALYEGYVEQLQSEYPYIIVKGEEYGYAPDTFAAKAAANQLPNLYTTFFSETKKIINAGYARDITDYMDENGYTDALNQQMIDIVSLDGKIYGIPYIAYVMGMWYNVDLFTEAGLVDENGIPLYPTTYDELIETAVTIKEKTGKAGFVMPTRDRIGGWFFLNLAWSYGTEFMTQGDDGKWTAHLNSAECVAALQYLKDLKWKYDVLPDNNLIGIDDIFKLVGTDQAAMSFGMDAHKDSPVQNYGMSKDNLSMGPVMEGPAGRYSQLGGATWMISDVTTDEQIDAIFKWLEVAGYSPIVTDASVQSMEDKLKASSEDGKAIITPCVPFSIWKDTEEILTVTNDLQAKYANVSPDLWPGIQTDDLVIKPEEPVNCQELYDLLDVAIQKVLIDEASDPQAILDELNEKFQTTYLDVA